MKKTRTKTPPTVMQKPAGLFQRPPKPGGMWYLTWRQNGVQKQTSLHTKNYGEAVALAAQIKACPTFQSGSRISDETSRFLAHKKTIGEYRRHSGEWAATPLKQLAD